MSAYRFSLDAKEDLIGVWLYTKSSWGEEQADRYQSQLHTCCQRLADTPILRRSVEGLDQVFVHHCQHHYLFGTQTDEGLVVVAVLHERMDMLHRLKHRLQSDVP